MVLATASRSLVNGAISWLRRLNIHMPDAVALAQFLQALASHCSHRLHDRTHAVRKVEEEDQIERLLLAREVYDGLGTPLVEHAEVVLGQAGQDSSIKRDFGIHVDQRHASAEYGSGLRR